MIDRRMQRCFAFRANVCVLRAGFLLSSLAAPEAEAVRRRDGFLLSIGVFVFGRKENGFPTFIRLTPNREFIGGIFVKR